MYDAGSLVLLLGQRAKIGREHCPAWFDECRSSVQSPQSSFGRSPQAVSVSFWIDAAVDELC